MLVNTDAGAAVFSAFTATAGAVAFFAAVFLALPVAFSFFSAMMNFLLLYFFFILEAESSTMRIVSSCGFAIT